MNNVRLERLARMLANPEFEDRHDALRFEHSTLQSMLDARRDAGLTRGEVAERMGIREATLARMERSILSEKGSPSFAAFCRYAEACGKTVRVEVR